jgi:hypothetical protein
VLNKSTSHEPWAESKPRYKLVIATDVHRLQVLVDTFLKSGDGYGFEPVGSPQVFRHEEYVQAFFNPGWESVNVN